MASVVLMNFILWTGGRGKSVDTIDIITFKGLFAMKISDKSVSIEERFIQQLHSLYHLVML